MRIFNADGSEAEMCGNGIRCFAKYCYENGIVSKQEFTVETLSGLKHVWLTLNGKEVAAVKVDMGAPNWERSSIPMVGQGTCINENLNVNGETFKVTCLSMGNPHCVIFVDNVDNFPVDQIGPKIENHKVFSEKNQCRLRSSPETKRVEDSCLGAGLRRNSSLRYRNLCCCSCFKQAWKSRKQSYCSCTGR